MVERNADVEEFLNSLPEQQSSVFRYMRDEYEALAERGSGLTKLRMTNTLKFWPVKNSTSLL
ncbi:hypothetical protein ACFOLK_00310 [Marinococcus halophilus]|uniref:hypothetical protein n=1 Tax=Marinococcus halophilus TaxID=1371 RepID=UPI00361E83B1